MNYGDLISRAWQIFWKQKALWLFNIVCLLPIYVYSLVSGLIDPTGGLNSSGFFIVCSTLIVALISLLLTAFAQTGIIRGVYKASQDSQLVLTFREIYEEVPPRFSRVLGLFLLMYAVSVVVFGILVVLMGGFAAFGSGGDASSSGLMVLCWCLLIPLLVLAGFVFQLILVALVTDDLTVGDAISCGWDVFRNNFGNFLVLGLILLGIGIGFGIIIGLPTYCVIGYMVSDMIASGVTDPSLMSGPLPWYYYPASMLSSLAGMLFSIFMMAVFVLVYLDLTRLPEENEQLQITDDEQESL